jgi:hypothetical protein
MSLDGFDFDDLGWIGLCGGYRVPYDPRAALRRLEAGDIEAWEELWNELYHQGDVGEASYAAVPHIVRIHEARSRSDWNTYALVAMIEEARLDGRNPELPAYLKSAYDTAWARLVKTGIAQLGEAEEPTLVCSIIGVIAFSKKQHTLGRLAVAFTEDERQELIDKNFG